MLNVDKIKNSLQKLKNIGLKQLFISDKNRFQNNHVLLDELLFDYSKNYINKEVLDLFIDEANNMDFFHYIKAMFNGEKINFTEHKAVLHTALRSPEVKTVIVDGINYYQEIWDTFEKYTLFAENIRNGLIRSSSQDKFTDIVTIGIGGSYLPSLAACEALYDYKHPTIKFHFASNIDSNGLLRIFSEINPKTTLFIISSKTFTTLETILNANLAKSWLSEKLGAKAIKEHFVAVTINIKLAMNFGIKEQNIFRFWDFIGGRYSIWTSISLPLVISIGKQRFLEFLQGAKIVDDHFKNAPLRQNIPFIMAVLTVIYNNYMNLSSEVVVPYSNLLSKFPLYLQQVVMESNGKSTDYNGNKIKYNTSPVIFGEVGTNAQHSFFQLLHQGTEMIPIDFIGFVNNKNSLSYYQDVLNANLIAQSEALMRGKSEDEIRVELAKSTTNGLEKLIPHKKLEGERPSNVLFFKNLNPKTYGILCALYEHKIFSLGIFWKINSFDQYGVEIGKILTKEILLEIKDQKKCNHDTSTNALVEYYKSHKNQFAD